MPRSAHKLAAQLRPGCLVLGDKLQAPCTRVCRCWRSYMPAPLCWPLQDGVLKLSDGLLSGLSAWSVRATASEEERQLAAQLVADFGKHGPAETGTHSGLTAGEAAVSCGPELEVEVVADRTLVSPVEAPLVK